MPRHQSAVTEKVQRPATPEHQRLYALIGSWDTSGTTIERDGAPAVPIHSSDTYEWLPGGHFVVHRWDGTVGDAEVHGLEVIGRDPQSGMYRTQFFDNEGNSGSEALTVHDRTWTWLGEQAMGANWHRCISVLSDDGRTMVARHEQSSDGKHWTPWMDVTLSRQETKRIEQE